MKIRARPISGFAILAAFVAAGALVYARALTAGFVADDWEFLSLVHHASSIAVCFDLLVGRFVRPLVMLTYYAGYRLFGIWPVPYHAFAILLHSVNAWLLYRVVLTLDPHRRHVMAGAVGLLFLAFAGHSEAVTWVAGLADPFVALCLLVALLAANAAIDAKRPRPWMSVAVIASFCALLAKESGVVVPLVVIAYLVARGAPHRIGRYAFVPILALVAFWAFRFFTYGNPLAAYGGLGAYTESPLAHVRMLLLRSFVPPSGRVFLLWAGGRDVPLLIASAVLLMVAVWRPGVRAGSDHLRQGSGGREDQAYGPDPAYGRRVFVFAIVGYALTIAPAFPLSLSLQTTESERMLYVPTAFAALLTVATIDALVRSVALKSVVLAALIAGHAFALQRINARWQAAGEEYDGVMRTLVSQLREHGGLHDGAAFVMSLPDNVHGAYVFRRGFHVGLDFYAPDLAPRAASIVPIESQDLNSAADAVVARRLDPTRISLDVSPNEFLSLHPPLRPFYSFPEWSRAGYVLRFSDAVGKAVILYVSAGQTHFLGDVVGPGAPFGTIDLPENGAVCDGDRLRFAGWALDDREVTSVKVFRDATPIGDAMRTFRTRPDVAAAYSGFPDLDRAGWEFELQCGAVSDGARISIQARDADGHVAELGSRVIRGRIPKH